VLAVSPNGVLGDPAGASGSEGASMLATLADDLVAAYVHWRSESAK
jgi:creatinine amidohydrolase